MGAVTRGTCGLDDRTQGASRPQKYFESSACLPSSPIPPMTQVIDVVGLIIGGTANVPSRRKQGWWRMSAPCNSEDCYGSRPAVGRRKRPLVRRPVCKTVGVILGQRSSKWLPRSSSSKCSREYPFEMAKIELRRSMPIEWPLFYLESQPRH